jgi:ribosomal protein S18 acetylase RimI-like enzyme
MNIRSVNLNDSKDAKDVLNLLNHYATDIMGGAKELSEYTQSHLIAALEQRKDAIILLAFDNATAVGLVIAFEGFSTFYAKPLINIHDIVVLIDYRGKGIAKLLLEEIERIAKERDCCKLTLEVLEGNKRAQSIYKTFGFNGYELDEKTGKALFWEKKLLY